MGVTIEEGLLPAMTLVENGYLTMDAAAAALGITTEELTQLLEDQKNAANDTGNATAVLSEKSLTAYDSIMGDGQFRGGYRAAYDTAREMVDGIISGFQEVAPVAETTVECRLSRTLTVN